MTTMVETRSKEARKAAKPSRRARDAKRLNGKRYGQLISAAKTMGVDVKQGTTDDIVARVMDRLAAMHRYACLETDKVPEDEFWETRRDEFGNMVEVPNKFYMLEADLRAEIMDYAGSRRLVDLEERRVRLAEFQAVLIAQAFEAFAGELGLTKEQQKRVGPALRTIRPMLEQPMVT